MQTDGTPQGAAAAAAPNKLGLLETVRAAVAERVQTVYADVRDAATSVSTRLAAIADMTSSSCMKDDSGDVEQVSLPQSHLALLDAARTKAPEAYAALIKAAAAFAAAPPLGRRREVIGGFDAVEAALHLRQ